MFKINSQKLAAQTGLTAFVLAAVAACAGGGSSSPGSKEATPFRPSNVQVSHTRDQFTKPEGGIVTVEVRRYNFSDEKAAVEIAVSAEKEDGQATKLVGDANYVATDFCAETNPAGSRVCGYVAVILSRSVGEKSEVRSFLMKKRDNKSQARGLDYEVVCSRDSAKSNSKETYEALRAECAPAEQPAQTPTPAPTATPVAAGSDF